MKSILSSLRPVLLGLTVFTSSLLALDVVPLPDGLQTQWDAVPVENYGGEHDVKVINGLWRFQPGDPDVDVTTAQPDDQWSHMWIPGSWHSRPNWNETGLVVDGTTPLWERYINNHREWPIGWFEREVSIPASWEGRAVFIDFSEISTRAQVWLDGNWCGALQETHGRVELTEHIRAGETQTLRVQVLAVPPSEPVLVLMGETAEQILLKPARLRHFGLVWDVELVTEPIGPNLQDLRLETSVSEKRFSITGLLDQGIDSGVIDLDVQVETLDGTVIKDWTSVETPLTDESAFSWSADWLADRLWDIDDPYLMNARIKASGNGWSDERLVRFGFREFEIQGRDFILNGTAVRMRPTPHTDMPQVEEVVLQWMRGIKSIGFNMLMVESERSPETMIKKADEIGMLMFVEVPELKDYVVRDRWTDENRASWNEAVGERMTDLYNHPSIVMWWSGFNVFAHGDDQNPDRIGQYDAMFIDDDEWERRLAIGLDAMDLLRAHDSTRGVYSHNGAIVGDIQTTNVYLCVHPLQEREEWLSDWAENGDMPFLACEFGLPLDNTFMQGRAGGGWTTIGQGENAQGSANSAMMLTEYSAIYIGPEAYELQTDDYADGIIQSHFDGFIHDRNVGWGGYDSPTVDPLKRMQRSDAYQKIQVLFNENSFRSWRAYGMTGGVNPWSFEAHTHINRSWRKNLDNMSLGPFVPGTRGKYRPEVSRGLFYNYMEGGWEPLPAADALLDNNQDLLAYIGGDAEQNFTDKDHQFYAGDRFAKQAVFINDMRDDVRFEASWSVEVDGTVVDQGSMSQTIEPGRNGFVPFETTLPSVDGEVVDGVVNLTVSAAGETLVDTFEFRVFPLPPSFTWSEQVTEETIILEEARQEIIEPGFWSGLFGKEAEVIEIPAKTRTVSTVTNVRELDPDYQSDQSVMLIGGDGTTRSWLENLGIEVSGWDVDSELPLVIGRGALESGAVELSELRQWVHGGGVVVLSSPTPEWVRDELGMRVTPHPSRRVFTTAQPHEISAGLSSEDLRDWNGSSTTVSAFEPYEGETRMYAGKPYYGWRWGNRGSVASYMIEKPHHSGWLPIFEGEFDLAYSPMMELPFGQGRVMISTFDLEDNVGLTPVADEIGRRLITYANAQRGASLEKGFVAYRGADSWQRILPRMGAYLTEEIDQAKVLVLGAGHGMDDTSIRGVLNSGRNVLLLRGAELPVFTGWSWNTSAGDFYGTTDVPNWPETRGLSIADFHSRAPYPFWRIEGEGVAAEGMLARKSVGSGVIIATGFDPTWIRSDQQPFMRLTGWRHSRNIVSLIASMGGGFELDAQIFNLLPLPTGRISLTGEWQLKWTNPMEAAPVISQKYTDTGITEEARSALFEDPATSSGWVSYTVPSDADDADPSRGAVDGEFVLQRTFDVPEEWSGEDLQLNLARVDDHDTTFLNGVEIGATGEEHPTPWSALRIYRAPGDLLKSEGNVISIRVMDLFGGSGISSTEHPVELVRPDSLQLQFYHPDYRRDFAYGDDPYRYYRW